MEMCTAKPEDREGEASTFPKNGIDVLSIGRDQNDNISLCFDGEGRRSAKPSGNRLCEWEGWM
jgi:hypothetical protein